MNRFVAPATCLAFCLLQAGAASSAPLRLKPDVTISGEIVRLGDLVEDAGAAADTPVFAAPALGSAGTIRADRIAEAAKELGLTGFDKPDLAAVIVRRPKVVLTAADLQHRLRQAFAEHEASLADAPITFDRPPADIETDRGVATATRITIDDLDLRSGRFAIRIGSGATATRLTGVAEIRFDLPVLARPLNRGDVIAAADLTTEKRARRELPAGVLTEPAQLIGTVARRALSPAQPLRQGDIAAPDLVDRNQLVTVSYETPGMNLTLRGRALAAGILGAVVPVQNAASKKTIEAVVIGPGRVTARLDDKTLKSRN